MRRPGESGCHCSKADQKRACTGSACLGLGFAHCTRQAPQAGDALERSDQRGLAANCPTTPHLWELPISVNVERCQGTRRLRKPIMCTLQGVDAYKVVASATPA